MASLEDWARDLSARVYGVALAVARDSDVAADVTAHVLARSAASPDQRDASGRLEESAICLASRAAPSAAFASMRAEDREVIALARVGGRSVAEIAEALDLDAGTVKAWMTRGLRESAGARAVELVH